jgi:coenzyme F420-reducing hydrogenase delta subunit
MPPRKVAAVVTAAVVVTAVVVTAAAVIEAATEVVDIFMVAAMAAGISAVMVAGISAAVCISAAGATSEADRLRGRVFAAIVLSPCIMPDRLPCGR